MDVVLNLVSVQVVSPAPPPPRVSFFCLTNFFRKVASHLVKSWIRYCNKGYIRSNLQFMDINRTVYHEIKRQLKEAISAVLTLLDSYAKVTFKCLIKWLISEHIISYSKWQLYFLNNACANCVNTIKKWNHIKILNFLIFKLYPE